MQGGVHDQLQAYNMVLQWCQVPVGLTFVVSQKSNLMPRAITWLQPKATAGMAEDLVHSLHVTILQLFDAISQDRCGALQLWTRYYDVTRNPVPTTSSPGYTDLLWLLSETCAYPVLLRLLEPYLSQNRGLLSFYAIKLLTSWMHTVSEAAHFLRRPLWGYSSWSQGLIVKWTQFHRTDPSTFPTIFYVLRLHNILLPHLSWCGLDRVTGYERQQYDALLLQLFTTPGLLQSAMCYQGPFLVAEAMLHTTKDAETQTKLYRTLSQVADPTLHHTPSDHSPDYSTEWHPDPIEQVWFHVWTRSIVHGAPLWFDTILWSMFQPVSSSPHKQAQHYLRRILACGFWLIQPDHTKCLDTENQAAVKMSSVPTLEETPILRAKAYLRKHLVAFHSHPHASSWLEKDVEGREDLQRLEQWCAESSRATEVLSCALSYVSSVG